MPPKIFMGTTQIPSEQTVGEIQRVLGRSGASAIRLDYEGGEVSSVSFQIIVGGGREVPFRLPCRWEAVHAVLMSKMARPRAKLAEDYKRQAKRIAWRQILRWVEAQMALVETSMVKMEEVFFPYITARDGKTIFERVAQNNFAQLEMK